MKVIEIVKTLLEAKEAYYNSDSPLMSDAEFDALEEKLRIIDPENEYFTAVGYVASDAKKIKHATPMLSMMKGKTMEDIASWINKIEIQGLSDFIIEPKIDGLSAACRYSRGKLVYVATRGNGIEGQDISHIAEFVKDIPESINITDEDIEVRGELYLPRNTDFDTEGRPLRNSCVGLINRKENRGDLKYVRFAAFRIVGMDHIFYESDRIDILKDSGFNTIEYFLTSDVQEIEEYYKSYLETYRGAWEYETDGLIICVNDRRFFEEIDSKWIVDHHNHYAIALKPPSEARETIIRDIAWQVSRQGNVIPVAIFDAIFIGGAKLSRAALNNYENVVRLKIQRGDTLVVERANDVIPFVAANKSSRNRADGDFSPDMIISKCPSCSSNLLRSGVHLKCNNQFCDEQNIQKIVYWVKNSSIENVAEASVRTLFEEGKISDVKDLYRLKKEDFEGIAGFADKKINNFLEEVALSKKLGATDFISKLGIPLVQKKNLVKMGINSLEDFIDFNDTAYVAGQNIVEWKNDPVNMKLFNELLEVLEIEKEEPLISKGKVAMTGKGPGKRSDLIKIIEKEGYEFSSTVTRDLAILICEDVNGKSSKLENARKNNIKLISYDDFFHDKRIDTDK